MFKTKAPKMDQVSLENEEIVVASRVGSVDAVAAETGVAFVDADNVGVRAEVSGQSDRAGGLSAADVKTERSRRTISMPGTKFVESEAGMGGDRGTLEVFVEILDRCSSSFGGKVEIGRLADCIEVTHISRFLLVG